MNISEFVKAMGDDDAKTTDSTPEIKEKKKEKAEKKDKSAKPDRKGEEFFAKKAAERAHKKRLAEDGMDLFFRNNNYIPAAPDEFEGHYPGNQNNVVLIPHKRRIKHG